MGSNQIQEVVLSANSTGGPSCATTTNQAAIDVSDALGASTFALLVQARLSGQTVYVYGTGSCDPTFTSVERIAYIVF